MKRGDPGSEQLVAGHAVATDASFGRRFAGEVAEEVEHDAEGDAEDNAGEVVGDDAEEDIDPDTEAEFENIAACRCWSWKIGGEPVNDAAPNER